MYKSLCSFILACFSFTSCCTVAQGTKQKVLISSAPANAHITIDGYACGTTPQCFKLERKFPHLVVIEKEGYQPQTFNIHSKVSPKVASNVWAPVGLTLAGTGLALVATGGATAGLAGAVVGAGAVGGLLVGSVIGSAGAGVDLYSGAARDLSNREVHANLRESLYTQSSG
jgi:hypothetical protein